MTTFANRFLSVCEFPNRQKLYFLEIIQRLTHLLSLFLSNYRFSNAQCTFWDGAKALQIQYPFIESEKRER